MLPAGRSLSRRILNDTSARGSLKEGISILVACSGGPDSIALLHILLTLREKFRLDLSVAHVNYRLRGESSEKDEALVRKYCKQYRLRCFVSHPARTNRLNEEALRDLRYRFFETIRKKHAIDHIAVAHTEDDQAETVLLRLFRGAGSDGLSGMRPTTGRIIRPLLSIPKRDLVSFLEKSRLPYRIDETNAETRIIRNRIRNELLPLLESSYQPNIRKVLARTARIFSEKTSRKNEVLPIFISGECSFSRKTFLALPDETQSDELRKLFRSVSKTAKNPSAAFIREAKRLIGSDKGKVRRFASGQLKIEARGDTVVMIRI